MKDNMCSVKSIEIKRSMLGNLEIFDISYDIDNYYRVCLIADYKNRNVRLTTNLDQYNDEPLFEYSVLDENLQTVINQTYIIFHNIIESEYLRQDVDFDLEVEVIDIRKLIQDREEILNQLDNELNKTLNNKYYTDKVTEFEQIDSYLDYIFLKEEIIDKFVDFELRESELN